MSCGNKLIRIPLTTALVPLAVCFAFTMSTGRAEIAANAVSRESTQRRLQWDVVVQLTNTTSASDRPVFESWYRAADLFSPTSSMGAVHGRSTAQSAEPQIVIFTHYNEAAHRHVSSNSLHRQSELRRLQIFGETDPAIVHNRSVPVFPEGAAVLLSAWWPVARDRFTAMPVWDPELNPPLSGGNSYITWKRVVAVDSTAGRSASPVSIDFAGRTFSNARKVGLDAFHYIAVDQRMAETLMQDSHARKAAIIALGRGLETGDYLALVAMHVATKGEQAWSWATLWWHDQPERGPFSKNRPREVRGPWRNYLLDVALDPLSRTAQEQGPDICFNPWLEARFPDTGGGGGTASNCIACHQRASFPPVSFLPITRGAPNFIDDPAFGPGRLRTDFLWSLARQASSPPGIAPRTQPGRP